MDKLQSTCQCTREYWLEEGAVRCSQECGKSVCCLTCTRLTICNHQDHAKCGHLQAHLNKLTLFLYLAGKIPVEFTDGLVWCRNGEFIREPRKEKKPL
jgi:hypothetical protein